MPPRVAAGQSCGRPRRLRFDDGVGLRLSPTRRHEVGYQSRVIPRQSAAYMRDAYGCSHETGAGRNNQWMTPGVCAEVGARLT